MSEPWTSRFIIVLEGFKEISMSPAELPFPQMHLPTTFLKGGGGGGGGREIIR